MHVKKAANPCSLGAGCVVESPVGHGVDRIDILDLEAFKRYYVQVSSEEVGAMPEIYTITLNEEETSEDADLHGW